MDRLGDLDRQLACRHEDEGGHAAAASGRAGAARREEPLDQGQREGGGLAGARGSLGEKVATGDQRSGWPHAGSASALRSRAHRGSSGAPVRAPSTRTRRLAPDLARGRSDPCPVRPSSGTHRIEWPRADPFPLAPGAVSLRRRTCRTRWIAALVADQEPVLALLARPVGPALRVDLPGRPALDPVVADRGRRVERIATPGRATAGSGSRCRPRSRPRRPHSSRPGALSGPTRALERWPEPRSPSRSWMWWPYSCATT